MKRTGMLLLIAALLAAAPALAAGQEKKPTDAQAESQNLDQVIQQKLMEFYQWGNENRENYSEEKHAEFARDLLTDVDISTLKPQHLEMLLYVVRPAEDLRDKVAARAKKLSRQKTVEGVRAAAVSMQLAMMSETADVVARLRTILDHPALDEALNSEFAGQLLQGLGYLEAETLKPIADELVAFSDRLYENLPNEQAGAALSYYEAISGLEDAIGKEKVNRIRKRTLAYTRDALEQIGDDNPRLTNYLERNVAYLDGAAARGELIGHTAPKITFIWAKGPNDAKSLADLKGNVVVLDFWATWCGPCIASFPEIRKLKNYYEGYDVAIVGLTSPQGFHMDAETGQRIDTSDDQEKELGLMPKFMEQKQINWTIAFSETNVFNPDFGVRGIPHLAILDAEGKVRHNGLHPMGTPMAKKVEMLNALLEEAGKPTPPPMEQETNENEEADG